MAMEHGAPTKYSIRTQPFTAVSPLLAERLVLLGQTRFPGEPFEMYLRSGFRGHVQWCSRPQWSGTGQGH